MARRSKKSSLGKRVVYVTEFRNAAIEVVKMYAKKGENAKIERETDSSGTPVFVVYVYPRW